MTAYAAALVLWSALIGIPSDPGTVIVWLFLGTVAWNIGAERRFHWHFVRDWSLPVLGLIVYFLTRGVADDLGIPVHVSEPIAVDRWLGGGVTPTERLQEAMCGLPCNTSQPHWWDVVLTTTYATHFVVGLTLAAVLWLRSRPEWVRWMRRYLAINFAAMIVYLAYPMAPPWWAALHRDGVDPDVHRITPIGWNGLGVERVNLLLAGMSNKVAAMPSLHAGVAGLVAVYGVQRLRSPWRFLLLLYPLLMGLALVYFAEHYVIDLLAGWLLAAVVLVGAQVWERRRG